MTAKAPQPEYIITESQQKLIIGILHVVDVGNPVDKAILKETIDNMSYLRPHTTTPDKPRPPCEECIWQHTTAPDKRVPYIECNHSYSSCPINWEAHNKAIARAATLAADKEHVRDLELIVSLCKTLRHHYPNDISLEMTQTHHEREIKRIESLRSTAGDEQE